MYEYFNQTNRKFDSLKSAISAVFGENTYITDRQPVYGGDINQAWRLILSDGSQVFMKSNDIRNFDFFKTEADGLNALRASGAIGVPSPLALGTDASSGKRTSGTSSPGTPLSGRFSSGTPLSMKSSPGTSSSGTPLSGTAFLLMEYLWAVPKVKNYWEVFGTELALLHRAETDAFMSENGQFQSEFHSSQMNTPQFGFYEDNYIGASAQKNTPKTGWVEFFRDCRLRPQMKMAEKKMDAQTRKQCERLLSRLGDFLTEPSFPSLLHGDLWSGNALCGPDGKAWIFDPAVYVGNYEAELAMTELFGRYPRAFYEAYNEVNQIENEYEERKDLYNLYHMLNHLNLFGGVYLRAVKQILDRYV